ncbi:MAG: hypothetical protein JNK15_15455 [Planctomycetes bacterium]|nr:hypothetical protein [Planctomycetota bacterium]
MDRDSGARPPRAVRFTLADLDEQIQAFLARWPDARGDRRGLAFVGDGGARLRVPLLAPRIAVGERLRDYAGRASQPPGVHLAVLLRAGAMAVGCWDGSHLVAHKAVRRYVVRGNGKAQMLHRKTRGRSRYGSRLRLQNWKRLLVETNERLHELESGHGPFERVFLGAPVRLWSELFAAEPPPPFTRDDVRLQRVPMHVHRPDFAELMRVHHWLGLGRLELPSA